jgi:hypothetical protein
MKNRLRLLFPVTMVFSFGLLLWLSPVFSIKNVPAADRTPFAPAATVFYQGQESEPNDVQAQANPMGAFWTMAGRIPVTQTDDVDWYRVTVPEEDLGRPYQAELEQPNPCARGFLQLGSVDWTSKTITRYLSVRGFALEPVDHDIEYELTVQPAPTLTPYPDYPAIHLSYREGAPGSIIQVTALNLPESDQVSITLNGRFIGAVADAGWATFQLDTTYADEGLYLLVVEAGSVDVVELFALDAEQPWRESENWGAVFYVPRGIAFTDQQFLAFIAKLQ